MLTVAYLSLVASMLTCTSLHTPQEHTRPLTNVC
jgi:hypothetical protein